MFIGCAGWPDCDVTYPLPKGKVEALPDPCPTCGMPQVKVTAFRSKPRTICIDPNCATNKEPDVVVGECPTCAAAGKKAKLIAQKNPRTLKRFIRCENYDECGVGYPLAAVRCHHGHRRGVRALRRAHGDRHHERAVPGSCARTSAARVKRLRPRRRLLLKRRRRQKKLPRKRRPRKPP